MKLIKDHAALMKGAIIKGDKETKVTGIEHDSRKVTEGTLFACIVGAHVDGHWRDKAKFCVFFEGLRHLAEDVLVHDIVVVKEEEVFACRDLRAVVAGNRLKGVFFVSYVFDGLSEIVFDLCSRFVRRTVVNDNDFERGPFRVLHALYATADHFCAVEGRYYDRDSRHLQADKVCFMMCFFPVLIV